MLNCKLVCLNMVPLMQPKFFSSCESNAYFVATTTKALFNFTGAQPVSLSVLSFSYVRFRISPSIKRGAHGFEESENRPLPKKTKPSTDVKGSSKDALKVSSAIPCH